MGIFPNIFTEFAVVLLLAPWLTVFERKQPHREMGQDLGLDSVTVPQIILFGLDRYGAGIAQTLRARGCRVVSVDYNPQLVQEGDPTGHPVLFGDAEDPEFIASLPLVKIQWIVSTARESHVNLSLIHTLQNLGYTGKIAVTAHAKNVVARLQQAGAAEVLVPFVDAAREAGDRILGQVFPEMPR